jgi:hypothetical protein
MKEKSMADQDAVVQDEYNEDALGSMMDNLYPIEGKEPAPAPEPKTEPEVTKEIKNEDTTKEEISVSSKDLPPGFDPTAKDSDKPVVEDIEVTDEAIDEAIENAPNDSYKKNIVNMRKSLQANKDTIKELRAQLEAKSDNNTEEIQQKLDAAYDKLGQFNLMEDPRFVEKYGKPMQAQLEQIKRIVTPLVDNMPEEDRPKDLNQLILDLGNADPVSRINWLKDNVPEEYRTAIVPYYTRVDEIMSERNAALKNHADTLKALKEEATSIESAKTDAYRNAVRSKVTSEVTADGFSIFEKREGNDEYNEFVDALHRNVDEIFISNDIEKQAKAMLLGVSAPVYRNMYETTQAKLDQALEEIESLKGAKPQFKGGGNQEVSSSPSEPQSGASIAKMLSDELDLQR